MNLIEVYDLTFDYCTKNENGEITEKNRVLEHLNFSVAEGEFIAILGANGCGKTTLARHLNALLLPSAGDVIIDGKNTKNAEELYEIRRTVGMVFQNPDNQLVAQTLEDEVAFGPENLGLPAEEIRRLVDQSLRAVGLYDRRKVPVEYLSGGQKQLAAIAGILAMNPRCIVLDEATSMLDPAGRKTVWKAILELHREKNIAIVMITHDAEEAKMADRVCVMNHGGIALQGNPADVFSDEKAIRSFGIEANSILNHSDEFQRKGSYNSDRKTMWINVENVSYSYFKGSNLQTDACKQISLRIHSGERIAVIGHTGSGKSTLLDLIAGLTCPDEGRVRILDAGDTYIDTKDKSKAKRRLRGKIGVLFQYPDHQLFEETVLTDVMFGPRNLGRSEQEARKAAIKALMKVNLPEDVWERSPIALSGGEKRKASLAGVLAMEPQILLLDEPTASLSGTERLNLFRILEKMNREEDKPILFTTHHMEDAAVFADRVIVLKQGYLVYDGSPGDLFQRRQWMEQYDLI